MYQEMRQVPKLKKKKGGDQWTRKDRSTRRCVDRRGQEVGEKLWERRYVSCTDLDEWKEVGAFQVVGPPKQKCILLDSSIWMEQNSHEGESWERHSGMV